MCVFKVQPKGNGEQWVGLEVHVGPNLLENTEGAVLLSLYERYKDNLAELARLLKMHRSNLCRFLKKHNIHPSA